VEVWAREQYAAAMRAQNRPPESDPKAISQYWTRRAVDEIKADPAAWLQLVAKKNAGSRFGTRKCRTTRTSPFSSRNISGCACCRCAGLCC